MTQTKTNSAMYPKKILLSVFIFALVVLAGKVLYTQFDSMEASFTRENDETIELAAASPFESLHRSVVENRNLADPALVLYRNEASRHDVLKFYTRITNDEQVSNIILDNASKNNIPPALAFALAWQESRYQIRAVNKNPTSTDRGLFQLNNRAFPKLTEKEFFDPELNARYGLSHLSYCLDLSGHEVTALAMYNAGTTKVRNNNTPKQTLDYASRILNYRQELERLFAHQVAARFIIENDGSVRPVN